MFRLSGIAMLSVFCLLNLFQDHPLSPKEILQNSKRAVVFISATTAEGVSSFGSGFIIANNGLILTANHVVRLSAVRNSDGHISGEYYTSIFVDLADGTRVPAVPVGPISDDSVSGDFAILKIARRGLTSLTLGSSSELEEGDGVTIVGFPLGIGKRYCLSGQVAARYTMPLPVKGIEKVSADGILLQVPAVSGLSGSPVISNKTGAVVGIISLKLAGITQELGAIRETLKQPGLDAGLRPGIGLRDTFIRITDTLDTQLANGLGAAVAMDKAKDGVVAASILIPKN